jgi:hypothetical protein
LPRTPKEEQTVREHPPIPPFGDNIPEALRDASANAIAEAVELAAYEGVDPADVGSLVARDDPRADKWRITDDAAAEWALRRYAAADDEIAELNEQADTWRKQIDDWLAERTARPAATRAFFGQLLADYALRYREATGRATVILPSGAVPTRNESPKAVVADADAFVAWANESMPEAVKRTPLVSELRRRVAITETETGRTIIDLSCGHGIIDTVAEPVGVGERVLCQVCDQPAAVVAVAPERTLQATVEDDGTVPPGVVVDPGGITVGSIRLTGR